MLNEKQIKEIKEHLERAQNPLFYYDNDADGLCAFLLLRRFINRGKGVAIRSYPELNKEYAKRVEELNADYVFVLDKPLMSQEFVDEVVKKGIPLIWIDHHDMKETDKIKGEGLHVYNSAKGKVVGEGGEPVSYLAYKVTEKEEDRWIALMGCISDHYLPDFASDFAKDNPELWNKRVKKPFDALFETEIGKVALALNFGLMDSTTHIVHLQNYLIRCKNPGEVFAESEGNKSFREKYYEVKKKYESFVSKAEEDTTGKIIFFEYGGDLSISSEIANVIYHKYPKKIVVVAYKKGNVANVSARGKNVRAMLENVLKKVEGHGGGHEDAVGARVSVSDLGKFRKAFEEEII
jgi:oligoribonuclease NrnB/cAMP/cGMP phosphodiesterase (DHH superfamily)